MRLLLFYPYIPYPVDRGTYQRSFHILRELARTHEVDLLALSEGGERLDQRPVFERFCRRVEFIPFEHPPWPRLFPDRLLHPLPTTIRHWTQPQIATGLDRFLAGQKYDLVHVCDIVMAQYFLKQHQDVPLAVDRSRVDLQFQLAQQAAMSSGLRNRLLDGENLWKLRRFERVIAQRAGVEVVCGPDDLTFVRAEISREVPVFILTNGVDLEFFRVDSVPDARAATPSVLFCGAMDYSPNVDALRWYFGEIHQRLRELVPDLQVWIVGKAPVPEVQAYGQLPGVTVTGGVPDVRPYYRRSWLQIVPLRVGGGTRLKIPECLAMGTPVVSTTIGAQGLDLVHDGDILLADTPADFARETARALQDAGLRERLTAAGLKTVHDRLGWPGLGRQLAKYYADHFPPRT
jgi:glycosyltransferase involved in cell wall biosynthesis